MTTYEASYHSILMPYLLPSLMYAYSYFPIPLMNSIPVSPLFTHYFSDGGHAAQGKTFSIGLAQKSWISLLDCFCRGRPDNRNSPLMLQMSY